jgi:hypothetical protein
MTRQKNNHLLQQSVTLAREIGARNGPRHESQISVQNSVCRWFGLAASDLC